jgi:hypothetical protein
VPKPADLRKQFIKAFERLSRHRERHDVLVDFLEMAVCAIRKKTVLPGPEADAIEARYMVVVGRNAVEDVRAMPELLGITALAMQEGGGDFLGQVVVELELSSQHMGQFFTPYDVSRMMAEMTFDTVDEIITEQGFVTVQEPACGAGGMIIAAADAIEAKGFDIGRQLYVDGTDISPLCFKMAYLQTSLRGIPATIRRGNTLSGEVFDIANTPSFAGFYATHKDRFDAWVSGPAGHDAKISQQNEKAEPDAPETVSPQRPAAQDRQTRPEPPGRQFTLFD